MIPCINCENDPCVCADENGELTIVQVIERARGRLEVYEKAARSTREHIAYLERMLNITDAKAIDILATG